jgi:HSP20 family protein
MTTNRWAPAAGGVWNDLQTEAARLWQNLVGERAGRPGLAPSYPPINLWEDGDNLHVETELPGMQLDRIELTVTGNQLTLAGERPAPAGGGAWHRQERGAGKFRRVVDLPIAVDPDKVEARFEQGLLSITLPKAESARARRIPVKAE